MNTDELIAMLARGAVAVEPNALRRRYVAALGWGVFGATLLMALSLGVRPDLAEAIELTMFWGKLAFPALLLAAALATVLRLSVPGRRLGRLPILLVAPVLAMWLLGALQLLDAAPVQRNQMIFGVSWRACPIYIAMLSLPAFIALFWAVRGLAPTRPVLAGGAAGLLAGTLGALVYALHCPEMAVPFLAIWYLLGMLIPAAAGAAMAPWLLRW